MIVFLASLALFLIVSFLVWKRLMKLRGERKEAELYGRRDLWVKERNRRAVLLFALWSISVNLLLGSLSYIDIRFLDLARLAGLVERVVLFIVAITLLFDRE